MIEYSVWLRRYKGSSLPDVCIFSDENRDAALRKMHSYCKQNGFSVCDKHGRVTIADITLVEKEPIAGYPVISETSYCELFTD